MNQSAMQACIDACLSCYQTCLATAMNHCLEMGGEHVAKPHFTLMMSCAEICRTAAHFMLIGSSHHAHLCAECAEICTQCAKDCQRLEGMEDCVAACERCAAACREMAIPLASWTRLADTPVIEAGPADAAPPLAGNRGRAGVGPGTVLSADGAVPEAGGVPAMPPTVTVIEGAGHLLPMENPAEIAGMILWSARCSTPERHALEAARAADPQTAILR